MTEQVGLWTWSQNGLPIMTIGDRVATMLDIIQVNGPTSVTNSAFSKGTPFFLYLQTSYSGVPHPINVTFSSNTMSVSGTNINGYLLYGVY